MNLDKLISDIKTQIDEAVDCADDLDFASWESKCGVLITVNEAKTLLLYIKGKMVKSSEVKYG